MTCKWLLLLVTAGCAWAAPLACDLSEYRATAGLRAELTDGRLTLAWAGTPGHDVRARFAIDGGSPVVRELAVRAAGGAWIVLGRDLKPEFAVAAGMRRIAETQVNRLRVLGLATPENIERDKWNTFWDSPLVIPGLPGINPNLPRRKEEVRRAAATFHATGCKVKTDGSRLEVSFDGLEMGIFSGRLQFTVYKGTNLLRQEAIAQTEEQSVAYNYRAGLRGFRIESAPRVTWQDVARGWQKYAFGGSLNQDPVALRARNRLMMVESGGGSIAVFPPPHKFFWAREYELNLGYVWFRKDDAQTFAAGVRQADHEEGYRPYGNSDDLWQRQVASSRMMAMGNFALYNAPPGTWQRMAVYYYLSPEGSAKAQQSALAFTHDDRYKPLPGFQVSACHFHTHFHEEELDAGTTDLQPPWIPTLRELGINIAMMSDFHGDGHSEDSGALRLRDQKAYFDASRRHSDRDFLIMPGEEPNVYLGGHYTMMLPKPVYWTRVRESGQPLVESNAEYGTVYHAGSTADVMEVLNRENGFVWQSHPRTKDSAGYPEAVRNTSHFRSERFIGAAFESLPVDLSESRLCETRCFGSLDDMNNWAGPKFLFAEADTYVKYPDDETYPHLAVNYLKLSRLPAFDEDWNPILKAIRDGDYFVTTGEVLIRNWGVEGTGSQRALSADVEWTFPLEFAEIVWGDGEKTGRQIVRATEHPAFGTHHFKIPFDPAGKKWIRFAVWDSAGNGAFTQPVHLK